MGKQQTTTDALIQELREAQAQLASIIDTAMDAIITVDAAQKIILFNRAAEHMFQCSHSDAVGQSIDKFIPERFRSLHRTLIEKFEETGRSSPSMGRSGTLSGIRANGQEFPIEATISFTQVNGKKLFTVMLRDITERRKNDEQREKAEQALRQSEERYRQLFEEDLTGNFVSKANGQLLSCNPAFLKVFGFTSLEQALSTNAATLYPDTSTREAYLELLRAKRKLEYYELELRRIDGKPVHVIETVIGSFDETGNIVELKGYLFDNTERKKLEEQLLQSQKMEAVGQLASGIAHDFNNVMAVVLTASHLLTMKSSDPDISRYAKMIEEATLRGSAIAKQLLQFSRAEAVKLVPISLSQTVLEAKKFLEHSFPKTVLIDVIINVQHGLVMADAGQIHQMILNLCINARDAILARTDRPPSGRIVISLQPASGRYVEERYGWHSTDHYVQLSVSDDGIGMSEETRRRIFHPFFTTKGIGKGTGLGLSIVHGIVKAHNAVIDVESREGFGSTFHVFLPAVSHQPIPDSSDQIEHATGTGQTILLIEDEILLRDLLTEFLVRAGYNVIEASDGEEGVAMYKAHANSVDIILSDIGLPKLGGEQVFAAIRKIDPNAKVIFCSGFIEEAKREMLLEAGAMDIVQKPYKVQEVLSALREALNRA